METTTAKQKQVCMRDFRLMTWCPECKGKLEDKGTGIIFQCIWEHEIRLKKCLKCGMNIWTPNGSPSFMTSHQRESMMDYDDDSWQSKADKETINKRYGGTL